jgi:hypothetical protein
VLVDFETACHDRQSGRHPLPDWRMFRTGDLPQGRNVLRPYHRAIFTPHKRDVRGIDPPDGVHMAIHSAILFIESF